MTEDEIVAQGRRRFALILWARALGVVLMVAGIIVWRSDLVRSGGWTAGGLPLFVLGFLASMALPQLLIRRWRTPPDR